MNSSNGNNKISDSIYPSSSGFLNNNSNSTSISSASSNLSSIYNSDSVKTTGGIIGFFKTITWTTWFIVIIILAVLGFNIFSYLAKGTQFTANIFEYVSKWLSNNVGSGISDTVKQTVNVSGVGLKKATNSIANVTDKTVDIVTTPIENENENKIMGKKASSSQNPHTITPTPSSPHPTNNSLDESLNNAVNASVQADDSYSSIQRGKGLGKSGWCFIGEDEGIRSCVEVGVNDTCMSGDIFPTSAVCVNPNLRA